MTNGFLGTFFEQCWSIVGQDLLAAIEISGQVMVCLKATLAPLMFLSLKRIIPQLFWTFALLVFALLSIKLLPRFWLLA